MTWPTKKLDEVCEISAGGSAPQGDRFFQNGEYPFFRTSDVGATHLSDNLCDVRDYLNDKGIKKLNLFKKGTILFPKSGASTFLNHRVIMGCDGYVASHLATISAGKNIDSRYLYLFLILVDAKDIAPNSSYPSLRITDIGKINIPLPPLEIQKKIVKKIEELFAKISQAQSLRESAIQDTNNLIPATLSKIFEEGKNKGWEKKELGELFEITSSKRVFKSEWTEHGIPFYRAREIVSMTKGQAFRKPIFVSEKMYEKYKEKYGVPKSGDILATGVGTLGITYCVKDDDKFYFKDGNIIWFKKKSDVNSNFIDYFFKSDVLRKQVDENAGGATVRTFTIKTANRVKIPLPPVAEQKKIVERMDALTQKVRELQKLQSETAANLTALKQSILHKAFEGRLIN